MQTLADALVLLVAALHAWFLVLEMFLWAKPIGLKTFRNTEEQARATTTLAANQGLYNGFLAAGLMWGLIAPSPDMAFAVKVYFLFCVVVAGTYGAWSVARRVFFVQALPAILALAAVWASRS